MKLSTDQLQELSVNDLLKTADKVRRSLDQNIFQLLFQPAIDPATLPAEPSESHSRRGRRRHTYDHRNQS
ncbi:hypothetical protein ACSE3M_06980 [Bacillus velezensis]